MPALDGLAHHLLTPAYVVPQALNLCGSLLFAAALGGGSVSVTAPVANGAPSAPRASTSPPPRAAAAAAAAAPRWQRQALPHIALLTSHHARRLRCHCLAASLAGVSLAANAVLDHALGDRLARPWSGALGVLLLAIGTALCSSAQAQAQAQAALQQH